MKSLDCNRNQIRVLFGALGEEADSAQAAYDQCKASFQRKVDAEFEDWKKESCPGRCPFKDMFCFLDPNPPSIKIRQNRSGKWRCTIWSNFVADIYCTAPKDREAHAYPPDPIEWSSLEDIMEGQD